MIHIQIIREAADFEIDNCRHEAVPSGAVHMVAKNPAAIVYTTLEANLNFPVHELDMASRIAIVTAAIEQARDIASSAKTLRRL